MSLALPRHPASPARRVLPTTRTGRIACGLGAAFVAWFVLNQTLVVFGGRDAAEGTSVLPFIAFGLIGLATGLAASAVALVALVRHHDRAILLYVLLLPGAFVVFLLLGELLFPH